MDPEQSTSLNLEMQSALRMLGITKYFAVSRLEDPGIIRLCVLWSALSVAALKQVLVTQLMAQDDGERLGRPPGGRLLRTTSLRTPVEHSSGRSACRAQDAASGDTGFYEGSEDYGEWALKCKPSSNCDPWKWRNNSSSLSVSVHNEIYR